MHFVSDKAYQRPGYVYENAGGGWIGYPAGMEPSVVWNHIDGPVLHRSDGGITWLTVWDRIMVFFSLTDVHGLDRKYCRRRIVRGF